MGICRYSVLIVGRLAASDRRSPLQYRAMSEDTAVHVPAEQVLTLGALSSLRHGALAVRLQLSPLAWRPENGNRCNAPGDGGKVPISLPLSPHPCLRKVRTYLRGTRTCPTMSPMLEIGCILDSVASPYWPVFVDRPTLLPSALLSKCRRSCAFSTAVRHSRADCVAIPRCTAMAPYDGRRTDPSCKERVFERREGVVGFQPQTVVEAQPEGLVSSRPSAGMRSGVAGGGERAWRRALSPGLIREPIPSEMPQGARPGQAWLPLKGTVQTPTTSR